MGCLGLRHVRRSAGRPARAIQRRAAGKRPRLSRLPIFLPPSFQCFHGLRVGLLVPVLQTPQLVQCPVQTALNPPFVPQQPLQDRVLPEVLQDHPPERRLALGLRGAGRMPVVQRPKGLVSILGGPAQPPGQVDDPRRQNPLQRPDRVQLLHQHLPVHFKFRPVFATDDPLPREQPVLERALGGFRLALRRPRPGGLLRVQLIGPHLRFARHENPSEFMIYDFRFPIRRPTRGDIEDML